jgi:hypothetical protein
VAAAPIPLTDVAWQHRQVWDEVQASFRALLEDPTCDGAHFSHALEAAFEAHFGDAPLDRPLGAVRAGGGERCCCAPWGIGPGDEVVTVPNSDLATTSAIAHVGARPVFADVEPGTFLLDPAAAARAITPRTRALMPVHMYGHPARMPELRRLADEHGLLLLEDATLALGAEQERRQSRHPRRRRLLLLRPPQGARRRRQRRPGARARPRRWRAASGSCAATASTPTCRTGRSPSGSSSRGSGTWRRGTTSSSTGSRRRSCGRSSATSRRGATCARRGRALRRGPRRGAGDRAPAGRRRRPPGLAQLHRARRTPRAAAGAPARQGDHDRRALHAARAPAAGLRPPRDRPGSFPVAEAQADRLLCLPIYPGMADAQVERVVAEIRSFANVA